MPSLREHNFYAWSPAVSNLFWLRIAVWDGPGKRVNGGYLTIFVRLRPGQAVVEVSDGTLSIAAAQPLVVALYRTAFLSGTVVRSWP
jgi:hypothetical protein